MRRVPEHGPGRWKRVPSARPAVLRRVEDMDRYDTIILGFPIWWGREPGIIDTFLEAYDLQGKTIIPFCTSAASGAEKAADHIRGIVGEGVRVEDGKKLSQAFERLYSREYRRSARMTAGTVLGILIPFAGTSLGAAMVFVLKNRISDSLQKILIGFAAGVMVAASFWSLLQPALESSEAMGVWSFVPAAAGFLIGVGFLLFLDEVTPHMHFNNEEEGPRTGLKRTTKLILAVTLHNIPEGMAVGVVYAGFLSGSAGISAAGALALALGIAIQNFPEGAIVSMPLRAEGMDKARTFLYGVLSGVVEPIAAFITVLAAGAVVPVMPYLLAFAAGAMMYVVVEELIPEMSEGSHSNWGTVAFSLGFVLMMVLDVALG